jgi:hypothetical protein
MQQSKEGTMLKPVPLTMLLFCSLSLGASRVHSAGSRVRPEVSEVRGFLFDAPSDAFTDTNVFAPEYVPRNRLEIPMLLVASVDLGESCVVRIVDGKLSPTARPLACEKPSGTIVARIKFGDGGQETRHILLANFFAGFNGKFKVPMLFYRRLPCKSVDVTVSVSGQGRSWQGHVPFSCGE